MWTVLSETVMAATLGRCGGVGFSEPALFAAPAPPALARPGEHHRLAAGDRAQLVVVAGPVGARRLADELGEAGGERAQARTAHLEADLGHGEVTAAQQRLGALDAPRHEVGVGRLGVRLAEAAAEVRGRHQRGAGERGDVERLRVLAVHPVPGPAKPAQLVEIGVHAYILHPGAQVARRRRVAPTRWRTA